MKLILVGPTDEGFWHLEDETGLAWRIVDRWEHHTSAAALFGWSAEEGIPEDDQAEAARDFLMENIGAEIEAPLHIAQHFERLQREANE